MASNIIESGGYDYAFVDTNLPDEFQCPICTLVPRDVHQASCCGKMFCRSCLDELKRAYLNYTCPNCREDLTYNCFKDSNTNRKIRHLHIYCTNRKCRWEGSLQDIYKHLSKCLFQTVECSNKCGTRLDRCNLENHLKKCPKRIVTCVYCHKEDEYQIINGDHYDKECPGYPLPCPNNGCEEQIKRRLMRKHRDTCPKEEVDCQYSKVGCHKKMKREDLPQHNKDKMEEHLGSAVNNIEKLKHTIKQLKQQQDHTVTKIKMVEFEALKESDTAWYSPDFYTHLGGYKLHLAVYANGCGDGEGTYVSCYVNLMPGEYDDTLEWPFQGEVTVKILNQLKDKNHCKTAIPFNDKIPDKHKNRKEKEDNTLALGYPCFIPHTDLGLNSSTNTQYLMNDTLYFRVSVNVHSKTKPWLAGVI